MVQDSRSASYPGAAIASSYDFGSIDFYSFPDKTETGDSNLFCKAVVVPTEPGDT